MALVYELVKRLNADEIEKISGMPMQDREKDVLAAMIRTQRKVFPASTICNQLKIQTSHFDKIKSNLLKKVLDRLAGHDVYAQVNFLNTKHGLWHLSRHLLRYHELKVLESIADPALYYQFYNFFFEWYISIPFSHQEEEELYNIVQQLIRYCPEQLLQQTHLHIRITLLRRELKLITSQAGMKLEEKRHQLKDKLTGILTDIRITDDVQIIYQARLLAQLTYTFLEDFENSTAMYSSLMQMIEANPSEISESDKLLPQVYHAQTLYHANNFDESYALYSRIYPYFRDAEPLRWFMYHTEYLHVSLFTGHMQTAKLIVENYFGQFSDQVNGSLYISAGLQVIKYYLYTKDYSKALQHIDQLENAISKTTLLQFQFALRELRTAYFYLTGNLAMAEMLAEKNLKFMRFKKIHKTIPEYTYHSRLVKAICKLQHGASEMSRSEEVMFGVMQKGTMAQYGHLLQRFYENVTNSLPSHHATV